MIEFKNTSIAAMKSLIKTRPRIYFLGKDLRKEQIKELSATDTQELFTESALDFLDDSNVLNHIVIGLAAHLRENYSATRKEIEFEFDRLGHSGKHDLPAVLLLLDMIKGYENAIAESHDERRQQWRESEARI